MVSLKTARALQARLKDKETIRLHATVEAGQHPGFYEVVTAVIPGSDPQLKEQEIAFSCHLDHQRPGANDNASGCATILEVARTLGKLIGDGRLARPARTIRFIWPPEVEGTHVGNARPDSRSASGRGSHGHGGRRTGNQSGVPRDSRAQSLPSLSTMWLGRC
jgi:hypothetical protein